MRAALRLARRGIGSVEPNPAVGCIIAKGGQVTGRGWHQKFGGPHAEINALEDCKKRGANPQAATMYVTLEPCCHRGKTGPCTEAIIGAGIAEVVAATIDPSSHAGGAGIQRLRKAGIEVRTSVCETEARLLNAPFMKFATTGKCWVIVKWAQSIDGKVAYAHEGNERRWISNEPSRKDAHKLRRRAQAILVGVNTVTADDPLLTARPSRGKKPTRIVLDTHLRVPIDRQLLSTARRVPVLIVTSEAAVKANLELANKIAQKGAELLTVPISQGRCDIRPLLDELSKRGVTQLLVEGGPTVITAFLRQRLVDEICVYIAPTILGSTGSVGITDSMAELTEAVGLQYVATKRFGDDIRLAGLTEKALRQIIGKFKPSCALQKGKTRPQIASNDLR